MATWWVRRLLGAVLPADALVRSGFGASARADVASQSRMAPNCGYSLQAWPDSGLTSQDTGQATLCLESDESGLGGSRCTPIAMLSRLSYWTASLPAVTATPTG